MPDRTLTDSKGNTYRIISNRWMQALTALCILNFVVLMLIIAGLIDNVRRVEQTMSFSDKMDQRNRALGDMVEKRVTANIWSFNTVCTLAKKDGMPCMENPQWYADPAKYPLIADDPFGAGLFPPKEKK